MKKRVISIVLALGMSFALLTGCGGGDSQQAAETEQTTDAKETGDDQQNTDTQEAADAQQTSEVAADAQQTSEVTENEVTENDAAAYNPLSGSPSMPENKYSFTWNYPYAGFTISVPSFVTMYKGQFFPADVGETGSGSGIFEGHIHYLARTDEEVMELDAYLNEHADIQYDDTEAMEEYQNKVVDFYDGRNMAVMIIIGLKGDMSIDDVLTNQYPQIPVLKKGEIGNHGNYSFYYVIPDYATLIEEIKKVMPEDMYNEFNEVMEHAEDFVPCINLSDPKETASLPEVGDKISFETTDLDGNTVTSAELFGGHKVTMINMWATWCGPCINELPDLENLSKELAEKDCQIVGICIDTNAGADIIEGAKSILSEKGVTYMNLVATKETAQLFPVTAVPTSFFVDSEGTVLTEPVTGAYVDQYSQRIEEGLQIVGE